LTRIQLKLWHGGVAGYDSLRQSFGQSLDWVTFMQRSKRGSYPKGAFTNSPDLMATGAVRLRESAAALNSRVLLSGTLGWLKSRRCQGHYGEQ
jgi:hypothetical protein